MEEVKASSTKPMRITFLFVGARHIPRRNSAWTRRRRRLL